MAMEKEYALAAKIKEMLERKHCRGLVTFTNRAGQVTTTGTAMSAEAAVGLMVSQIFTLSQGMNTEPQTLLERIGRMLAEREDELRLDTVIKHAPRTNS